MLPLRGSICMGVDSRNHRFAPGLPPGRMVALREDGRNAENVGDGARHRLRLRRHRPQEVHLHPSRRMVSNAIRSVADGQTHGDAPPPSWGEANQQRKRERGARRRRARTGAPLESAGRLVVMFMTLPRPHLSVTSKPSDTNGSTKSAEQREKNY